ncbi:MAG: glycosyltransferase [Bacteroidales bacterium]|nr:glycosyltransferase [Bacteroidales bacterium]
MNTPLITIIIPVYNAEKYLHQCLDSVVAQTYTNWECLLIDDGSKDSSGVICDEYAAKDSRFRIFHKENGGVSSARNLGLDNAKGELISFVDSDDTVNNQFFNYLLELLGDNDIVSGGYVKIQRTELKNQRLNYESIMRLTIKESIVDFYRPYNYKFNAYIWNRIFKKSIIDENKIRFRENIHIKEDGLFLMQYLVNCKGYCNISMTPIYNYITTEGSAMNNLSGKYNPKIVDSLHARIECLNAILGSNFNCLRLRLESKLYIVKFYTWFHSMSREIQISDSDNVKNLIIKNCGVIGYLLICPQMIKLVDKLMNIPRKLRHL